MTTLKARTKFSRFVLRGIFGGIVGGQFFLIGDLVHDKLRMGYVPYGGAFQFMAMPYFLVFGVVLGASIGCLVWATVIKARIEVSLIESSLIGASLIFILGMLLFFFRGDASNGLIPPTQMEQTVTSVMFVTFLGALPGLFAYPGKTVIQGVERPK